jgi:TolB-like protein
MSDDPRPALGSDPSHAPGERLESWKEIAAYLRRDVRTVQRWEQTDGLPVRRLKRAQRPIPYAYKAELDAWWTSRSENGALTAKQDARRETPASYKRQLVVATAALLVTVAIAGAYWVIRPRLSRGSTTADGQLKTIAVLPFLDLTEGMKAEEFADGLTEELIDKLNKIPGLRVPAPTSSFYFKNKHVPITEIARTLHAAYVLDGSVRKSGTTVRVAARLIRADNAAVVWSESYDRPWNDILIVQDEVAGEVTKALRASIDAGSERRPQPQ